MSGEKVKYIFLNGKIIPFSDGKIHVMSSTVRYGSNVFEGIRGYWNEDKKQMYIFKLKEHLERLIDSMKLMRFEETFELGDLKGWILDLIRKNELREDIHIRPQVFLDGETGAVAARGPVGIAISAVPMGRYLKEEGVTAMVSSWRRIDDDVMPARIKCAANYQNARFALMEATANGYDATIILNRNGKVTEEARACLFICRDGIPITPPVTYGILESITRKTLLMLFQEELNIRPLEREIDRTELYIADEGFFCGSGMEVTPIISVDGHPLLVGPITSSIKEVYLDIATGKVDKYGEWRTPVY
jgi:branched-chain amino acid aminotransferase